MVGTIHSNRRIVVILLFDFLLQYVLVDGKSKHCHFFTSRNPSFFPSNHNPCCACFCKSTANSTLCGLHGKFIWTLPHSNGPKWSLFWGELVHPKVFEISLIVIHLLIGQQGCPIIKGWKVGIPLAVWWLCVGFVLHFFWQQIWIIQPQGIFQKNWFEFATEQFGKGFVQSIRGSHNSPIFLNDEDIIPRVGPKPESMRMKAPHFSAM